MASNVPHVGPTVPRGEGSRTKARAQLQLSQDSRDEALIRIEELPPARQGLELEGCTRHLGNCCPISPGKLRHTSTSIRHD